LCDMILEYVGCISVASHVATGWLACHHCLDIT